MRQWLVKVIPVSLKIAAACGIGLFLAEIGLSYSAGIGAITGAKSTPLEIAGCPEAFRDEDGFCTSNKMTSPTVSRSTLLQAKCAAATRAPANFFTDVDWHLLWRRFHGLSDVIQGQERNDCRHCPGVNHILAVSSDMHVAVWNRLLNSIAGVGPPSPTSPTPLKATTALTSSRKSRLFTQSTTRLTRSTGTSPKHHPILHSLSSPFFMWISLTVQPLSTAWRDSLAWSIPRLETSHARLSPTAPTPSAFLLVRSLVAPQ